MISYDNMFKQLHEKYPEISISELEEKLERTSWDLKEYSPQEKHLRINHLILKGKKPNGNIISEKFDFFQGVNLLYSNGKNHVGKSTVLAIIYFCFTGSNKIDNNMTNWFSYFELDYSINSEHFKNKFTKVGKSWNLSITQNHKIIEEVKVTKDISTILNRFFLQKFNYYQIGYTKTQGKKSNTFDLDLCNFSWKTYFKTIFLFQKEYNSLISKSYFGKPNQILHHMLNLKYKELHNKISIKEDFLNAERNKNDFLTGQLNKLYENFDSKKIENKKLELTTIDIDIKKLENQIENLKNDKQLKKYKDLNQQIFSLSVELEDINEDIRIIEKQNNKIIKYIKNLQNSIDCNFSFYLEPEYCPVCLNEISDEKIKKNREEHKCILCNEDIIHNNFDQEKTIEKLECEKNNKKNLEQELKNLLVKKEKLENCINSLKTEQRRLMHYNIDSVYEKVIELKKIREYLLKEFPVLMAEPIKESLKTTDKSLEIVKEFNKIVLFYVKEENKRIFTDFSALIKTNLKKFTHTNITDVIIDENSFLPLFIKDNTKMTFEQLSAGEEGRAKLAIFISLLIFSLENKIGNTPYFLVIDSPAREEMDIESIQGLSDIIKELNKKYSDKIQIIIASATDLTTCTEKSKIISKTGEFF